MNPDLQQVVAQSADAADLHAPVPALLLELQTMLGSLTATVTAATERGRRPFRPSADLPARLGDLAYGVYLLADQTGVDLEQAVGGTAHGISARAPQPAPADQSWPLPE